MNLQELMKLTDEFIQTQKERLEQAKKLAALEERESALKEKLIQISISENTRTLPASNSRAVNVHMKMKPRAEDWGLLYGYIHKHSAWDLLQKRIGENAVEERKQDGIVIPGIIMFPTYNLTIIGAKK